MKAFLRISIAIIIFLLCSPSHIAAQEKFTTDYKVTYQVEEDENTNARLDVTLTNSTETFFASTYTLHVGFENIVNVSASDSQGAIQPKIKKTESGNAISLVFNQKSIGKNKKTHFTLSFDTSDVAKKRGDVWEINIPGITNLEDFTNFTVEVVTPDSFGEPTYIKPQTPDNTMIFSKDILGKSGISIAFGTEQLFDFDLTYNLHNNNIFPITTEIALPPTTNYQEVFLDSLSPAPLDVVVDTDGNWLAKYYLKPSEKKTVKAKGQAKLQHTPKEEILTEEQRQKYTTANTYWEKDNSEIKRLAKELKTPEAIYAYVVKTLRYDFTRVNNKQTRLGAVKSLKEKDHAVCLEFTDLFIALARAADIPARELNGYAHTENSKQRPLSLENDILHAWPEYYDNEKNTWVMVDPTWGSTTGGIDYFNVFDFDHFVFVRKGAESIYPIPAGGYKFDESSEKKDIHVTFSDDPIEQMTSFDIASDFENSHAAGLPISGKVSVKNTGNHFVTDQTIDVLSNSLTPHKQLIHVIGIPPYGKKSADVRFDSLPFLTNGMYEFTIETQNDHISEEINVAPVIFSRKYSIGGIIIVTSIILLIIAIKTRRIPFSRR